MTLCNISCVVVNHKHQLSEPCKAKVRTHYEENIEKKGAAVRNRVHYNLRVLNLNLPCQHLSAAPDPGFGYGGEGVVLWDGRFYGRGGTLTMNVCEARGGYRIFPKWGV